jgi:broad specificity phosphatase PhoE
MKLYIARHGETDLNLNGDCYQGSTDEPLNARGRSQAAALALALPDDIDLVVTSPLARARQTAQALVDRRGLPLVVMAQFRERDFGIFETLSPGEVQRRHPQLWARNVLQQWDAAPPGGETPRQVVTRVAEGLQSLQLQWPHASVALVVHGFVIRSLRFLLDGLPEQAFFVQPKLGNGEFLSVLVPAGKTAT